MWMARWSFTTGICGLREMNFCRSEGILRFLAGAGCRSAAHSAQEGAGPGFGSFLTANGIRYDAILYGMPAGERILVNDCKPSGLLTAVAVNKKRNDALFIHTVLDESL